MIEHPSSRKLPWADVLRITKRFSGEVFNEPALRAWAGVEDKMQKAA